MPWSFYTKAMAHRILVVDNEVRYRELITHLLCEADYQVDEADDGTSALQLLTDKKYDLMICDVVMPRLNAFDILEYIETHSLPTLVILITGHPYLLADKGLGHLTSFTKPFNMYDLLHKVNEMLAK
jgi:DNA-binding NtrC family response regulator